MEISTQPIQYELSVDDANNYVDKVPTNSSFVNGIVCGCGSRTVFKTRQTITTHFKTVGHQKWIEQQNKNKENHFAELVQLRELVRQQVLLIAERDQKIIKLEKNIREKDTAIRALSSILNNPTAPASDEVDLLDIDP